MKHINKAYFDISVLLGITCTIWIYSVLLEAIMRCYVYFLPHFLIRQAMRLTIKMFNHNTINFIRSVRYSLIALKFLSKPLFYRYDYNNLNMFIAYNNTNKRLVLIRTVLKLENTLQIL